MEEVVVIVEEENNMDPEVMLKVMLGRSVVLMLEMMKVRLYRKEHYWW